MLSLERWKASTSQTAEPAWRRLVAACAAMVAADAADAAAAPVAPSEPLTRFCPGCGSVGPVPDTYRDCCPDGSDARMIPERLAGKCRNLFLLALDAAAPVAPQAAPADPLDWPLPCDVTVGHGTMRKGVKLRTLVARMKALYAMATDKDADAVAERTSAERTALHAAFVAQLAAPVAQPLTLDQIGDLEAGAGHQALNWDTRVSLVRAVERACAEAWGVTLASTAAGQGQGQEGASHG
jgi:hypothetical protein